MTTKTERTEIELLKQEQTYMNKKIDNIEQMLKDFIKSADDKYASKLTEKILYGFVGLILLAFAGVIISRVIPS